MGSFHIKELLCHMLDLLLGEEKTLTVGLPDRGVTTLMKQPAENRLVHHLLFAHTTNRGTKTEVIEDIVPLYDIPAAVRLPQQPTSVTLEPQGEPLDFTYQTGILRYTVPKVEIHQMVCIQL